MTDGFALPNRLRSGIFALIVGSQINPRLLVDDVLDLLPRLLADGHVRDRSQACPSGRRSSPPRGVAGFGWLMFQ